jgi:hypothetical protein
MFGAMMRRFGSHTWLAWVACLLTFGASGDDINLVGLVLPPEGSAPSSQQLPLDDPNSDFTAPGKSSMSQFKDSASWPPGFCWCNQHWGASSFQFNLVSIPVQLPATTGFPSSSLDPPLRC